MLEFVLEAWYPFAKNQKKKILRYLIYLKPSADILLILKAIKFAFQHLLVFFQNFSVFHLVIDRR